MVVSAAVNKLAMAVGFIPVLVSSSGCLLSR